MSETNSYASLDLIAAPLFVLENDKRGLPVYRAVNVAARAISGRPLTDYLGRTAAEVYDTSLGHAALSRHRQVMESGVAATYDLLLPGNGVMRELRTTLSPDIGHDGRVLRLYGTSFDMTQQNAACAAQVSWQTATAGMERFVTMAAQDLRAPMHNIAMLADMIGDGIADDGAGKSDLIAITGAVAAKALELMDDVLAQAQALDAGRPKERFEMQTLADGLRAVLNPNDRHILVTPAVTLHADRTALHIVLRNLLDSVLKDNAMKDSVLKQAGRDRVRIDVTVETLSQDMLLITVQDDGAGFTDAGLRRMNGGDLPSDSGYGLFGIRRILGAGGGTLHARNAAQHGGGAVIRFTLPGRIEPAFDACTGPEQPRKQNVSPRLKPGDPGHSHATPPRAGANNCNMSDINRPERAARGVTGGDILPT